MSSDASLFTGVDGNRMFENEKPSDDQQNKIDEQRNLIAALIPNADSVLAYIKEEREAISDFRSYVSALGDKPNENAIKDEYRARELYFSFLDRFESDVLNKLGTAKEMTNG